jgi:hypothetical protein
VDRPAPSASTCDGSPFRTRRRPRAASAAPPASGPGAARRASRTHDAPPWRDRRTVLVEVDDRRTRSARSSERCRGTPTSRPSPGVPPACARLSCRRAVGRCRRHGDEHRRVPGPEVRRGDLGTGCLAEVPVDRRRVHRVPPPTLVVRHKAVAPTTTPHGVDRGHRERVVDLDTVLDPGLSGVPDDQPAARATYTPHRERRQTEAALGVGVRVGHDPG